MKPLHTLDPLCQTCAIAETCTVHLPDQNPPPGKRAECTARLAAAYQRLFAAVCFAEAPKPEMNRQKLHSAVGALSIVCARKQEQIALQETEIISYLIPSYVTASR